MIDADAILADDYTHVLPYSVGKAAGRIIVFTDDIENAPTVDAVEVVHGHWIEKELFIPWCDDDVDIIYECSCCGTESGWTSPYCPNCGAKMDEVSE